MKVKVKVWGSKRAVELFLNEIDENYLAIVSKAISSSQGDWHGFATIDMGDK